jgi:hypothetical protein
MGRIGDLGRASYPLDPKHLVAFTCLYGNDYLPHEMVFSTISKLPKSDPSTTARSLPMSSDRRLEMNSLRLKGKISGALIALAILFGVGIASSATAQAQYRNDRDWRNNRNDRNRDSNRDWSNDRNRNGVDDRYEQNNNYGYGNNGRYGNNGGYGGNVYASAMNQGYQDGLYTGSNDGQKGQSYNPQRSHFWREANNSSNSGYGNRGQSIQAYRDGFLRGYDAGFRQYSRNGNYGYGNNRSRSGNILGQIFGRP